MGGMIRAGQSAQQLRERVRREFQEQPGAMTLAVARLLEIPEVEVIRALAPETVTELDASRWQDLVRDLEALGKVHVIVTSGGATLEVNGAFGHFSDWGGYFNVQTSSLDMHIRNDAVAAVFAVEKPSHMDGIMVQSFQFYSAQGSAAFKVFLSFGGSEAPADRQRRYAELRAHYARQSAGSS